MNTESVHVHKAALNVPANSKSYGEGSSVYLRVLKDNGGGKFTVAFGGNRFLLNSEIPLKPGDSFLAKIQIQGNKIFLVREASDTGGKLASLKPIGEALAALFDENGNITEPQLSSYFEKLGLAPDSVNYFLFQTLKSLSLPFSRELMWKARKIALRFEEKQKGSGVAAGKAYLSLVQKGIEPGIEEIEEFLGGGDSGYSGGSGSGTEDSSAGAESHDGTSFESGTVLEPAKLFAAFFNSLSELQSSGKSYSGGTSASPSASPSAGALAGQVAAPSAVSSEVFQTGLLTLFNHSGFSRKALSPCASWIKIPVEYSFGGGKGNAGAAVGTAGECGDGKVSGGEACGLEAGGCKKIKGDIMLYLRPDEKKVEKICGNVTFFEKNYKFVVLLNNSVKKIILNEEFDFPSFKESFPDWEVSCGSEEDFAFPSGEESVILVDGRV